MHQEMSRRRVVSGMSWGVPAVALAVAAPAASASPATEPVVPVVTVSTPIIGWTDGSAGNGYIAQGVVVTVTSSTGQPLANQPVTLTITNYRGNENTFYFVKDPTIASNKAFASTWADGRRVGDSITLYTDANGRIALDDGKAGYLRHGTDGESRGTNFVAESGGVSQAFTLYNSSGKGYTEKGIRVA